MFVKELTYEELCDEHLDLPVTLLNEDWNEPDEYEVGRSVMTISQGCYVVVTETKMRYRKEFGMWDDWFHTQLVSTWQGTSQLGHPELVHVMCLNLDGTVGYHTSIGSHPMTDRKEAVMHEPVNVQRNVIEDPDPFSEALAIAKVAIDTGIACEGRMNAEELNRLKAVQAAINVARS